MSRKSENTAIGLVIFFWVLAILVNLGFWGFVIWAIWKLVNHVTA